MIAVGAAQFTGASAEDGAPATPRPLKTLVAIALPALVAFSGFVALGVWQLERRVWKLDLIERVETRVHGAAQPVPGPAAWPDVTADGQEYLRVKATGAFVPGKTAFVQAVTELGPGYWVLAPLKTDAGFTLLVNRGFAPADRREAAAAVPSGAVTVTGLLRMTEPKGGFLRSNDPAADLWRSRDVAAIAASRGLESVAPYFVDADATRNPGGAPIGGLTVVQFRNHHLVYALTWFGLALMVVGGAGVLARHEARIRRAAGL